MNILQQAARRPERLEALHQCALRRCDLYVYRRLTDVSRWRTSPAPAA
jgi:hypothetical protein